MNIFKKWLSAIIGVEESKPWVVHIPARDEQQKETGEENANKFIAHVIKSAFFQEVVVIEYDTKWIWMKNPEWRNYVCSALMKEQSPFSSALFSPPDEYDDSWTFAGYVKENSRKVKDLSLTDSL